MIDSHHTPSLTSISDAVAKQPDAVKSITDQDGDFHRPGSHGQHKTMKSFGNEKAHKVCGFHINMH